MRGRRLIASAVVAFGCVLAALALGAGPARATGLCDNITVPELLDLRCTPSFDAAAQERAIVEPEEGMFRLLSRLSLRQLDPVADRQAWNEPAAWLEQQMILDLDGVASTLRELADDPDSPFGGEILRSAIDFFAGGLEDLSRLPLAACDRETRRETELTCRFGVEPLGLLMKIMLVADGDDRYAFNIRSFNEQRLRHFTAIANSFAAP